MSAWREETSDRERCLRGERRRVTKGDVCIERGDE
jgi:hypothetical protein